MGRSPLIERTPIRLVATTLAIATKSWVKPGAPRPPAPGLDCFEIDEEIDSIRSISLGPQKPKSTVSFGTVEVREYNLTLGDHPCCTMGCPLSLGWEYSQQEHVPVDTYEAARCPRRDREQLKTSWADRREMLSDVASDGEVKRLERKLHRERNCQRKVRARTCAAFFQTVDTPSSPTQPPAAVARCL